MKTKLVNIKVSTVIDTDFFIEVPEGDSNDKIIKRAKQEVKLPTEYPFILNKYLRSKGINIMGLDSMLKSWNNGEIKYEII